MAAGCIELVRRWHALQSVLIPGRAAGATRTAWAIRSDDWRHKRHRRPCGDRGLRTDYTGLHRVTPPGRLRKRRRRRFTCSTVKRPSTRLRRLLQPPRPDEAMRQALTAIDLSAGSRAEAERQLTAAAERQREVVASMQQPGRAETGQHVAIKAVSRAVQLIVFALRQAAERGVPPRAARRAHRLGATARERCAREDT
jgi:hypothetical protein